MPRGPVSLPSVGPSGSGSTFRDYMEQSAAQQNYGTTDTASATPRDHESNGKMNYKVQHFYRASTSTEEQQNKIFGRRPTVGYNNSTSGKAPPPKPPPAPQARKNFYRFSTVSKSSGDHGEHQAELHEKKEQHYAFSTETPTVTVARGNIFTGVVTPREGHDYSGMNSVAVGAPQQSGRPRAQLHADRQQSIRTPRGQHVYSYTRSPVTTTAYLNSQKNLDHNQRQATPRQRQRMVTPRNERLRILAEIERNAQMQFDSYKEVEQSQSLPSSSSSSYGHQMTGEKNKIDGAAVSYLGRANGEPEEVVNDYVVNDYTGDVVNVDLPKPSFVYQNSKIDLKGLLQQPETNMADKHEPRSAGAEGDVEENKPPPTARQEPVQHRSAVADLLTKVLLEQGAPDGPTKKQNFLGQEEEKEQEQGTSRRATDNNAWYRSSTTSSHDTCNSQPRQGQFPPSSAATATRGPPPAVRKNLQDIFGLRENGKNAKYGRDFLVENNRGSGTNTGGTTSKSSCHGVKNNNLFFQNPPAQSCRSCAGREDQNEMQGNNFFRDYYVDAWLQYEDAWDEFEKEVSGKQQQIRLLSDIPFPPGHTNPRTSLLTRATNQISVKDAYYKLVLRYHPDKFLPKFGHRVYCGAPSGLHLSEEEDIKTGRDNLEREIVKKIEQICHRLNQEWKGKHHLVQGKNCT